MALRLPHSILNPIARSIGNPQALAGFVVGSSQFAKCPHHGTRARMSIPSFQA
jgi:hypothetical protein